METIVSDLLERFEKGKLTRRQVIQALALVAATPKAGAAAGIQGNAGIQVNNVNHVSVFVSNMARSIEFYSRAFGLRVQNEDKQNQITRLESSNKSFVISLRVVGRPSEPNSRAGVIDHFAFGMEKFDQAAMTRDLAARGVKVEPSNIEYGYHVKDPDGAVVQLVDDGFSMARPG